MKKKGLIISTVVMVVVLIAALTTATYAWFTAADSVKVDSISLSVKSSAKVNVGVRINNTTGYDGYRNGEMTPAEDATGNTVSWTDNGYVGLGSLLTFNGLDLGKDKAIGSSVANTGWNGTSVKFDDKTLVLGTATNPKYIVKAKGAGTTIDYDTAEMANANRDYLDATIGIEANDAAITGTYVKVTVTTTDSNKTLGINAAVHFIIIIDGKYIDFQPFGEDATVKNTTLKTDVVDNALPTANKGYCKTAEGGQVASTFYFWVGKGTLSEEDGTYGVLQTGGQQISDFRILAYIDGTDGACVKDATGACKIDIEFDGTKDTKLEKLGDTAQTAVTTVKFIEAKTNVPA